MLELPGPRREALRKLGAVLVQVNPSQLESDWMVDLAVQLKITCLVHISSGSVVASAAVSRWWFRGSIHHDKELVAETALHDYVPIKVSASCPHRVQGVPFMVLGSTLHEQSVRGRMPGRPGFESRRGRQQVHGYYCPS